MIMTPKIKFSTKYRIEVPRMIIGVEMITMMVILMIMMTKSTKKNIHN